MYNVSKFFYIIWDVQGVSKYLIWTGISEKMDIIS